MWRAFFRSEFFVMQGVPRHAFGMRHSLATLAFATTLLAVALASADGEAGTRPACAQASHNARFDGSGYSHIVSVTNTCDYALTCTVTTNANPRPATMRISAGQSGSVNTFLSSPAREFTPTVNCEP